MKGFVAYEKLSKRKKREIDRRGRGSWGDINPVTRRPEKPGVYKRSKRNIEARRWSQDNDGLQAFGCNFGRSVRQ